MLKNEGRFPFDKNSISKLMKVITIIQKGKNHENIFYGNAFLLNF